MKNCICGSPAPVWAQYCIAVIFTILIAYIIYLIFKLIKSLLYENK